jgi:uncharacterized delta-60 repeat protein
MKRFYYLMLILIWSEITQAQPGSLDQTFGQGGKVVTDIGQTNNVPNSVLIQPDGKIIVIGYSTPAQYQSYISIVRYNNNGTLDNSFGVDGVMETKFSQLAEDATLAGALQSDGKIIAAGYTWNGNDHDFAMMRLNSDGTRDLTFGSFGIVITDFNNQDDKVNHIILQPNGKIILAGYTSDPPNFEIDMALARYDISGTLDDTFGSNGKLTLNIGEVGFWQSVRSVALQTDGKILAAGYTEIYDEVNESLDNNFALVRFDTDGSLDSGFGTNGIVITAVGKDDIGLACVVQPDGRILVLGKSKPSKGGFPDLALVRYSSNGARDNNFGNNGIVLTSFDNTDDVGNSLVLQLDQKIIAFGYTARNNGSTLDFAMARYHPNGTLDNSFGTNGKVITDISGDWDFGTCAALQSNGKIVVTGYSRANGAYNFALARYNNDTALPVTLAAFEISKQENHVLLKWKTTSEENSDRFEIQRSADGKKWDIIGTVKASKNSRTEEEYALLDSTPNVGRNFYRLKMIDVDESFSFSRIRSVLKDQEDMVRVYPNPASERLQIQIVNKVEIANSELLDSDGRSVYSSKEFTENIDLTNVPNGIYSLVLRFRDGSRYSKMVLVAR